ncbi:MAG: Photosystem I assembly protein Ycf3 [Candidatus Omnitrophica bacterium]|nr:Photosystem I assembly protein Ycf3 [Candidatus Omnitrophota bacterium]
MKKKQRRHILDNARQRSAEQLASELGLPLSEVRRVLAEAGPAAAPTSASTAVVTAGPQGPSWRHMGLVAAVALALRAVHLAVVRNTPLDDREFILDSAYYLRCAEAIAAGRFFDPESVYGSPLYPFYLALSQAVTGSPVLARLVQVVLDACTAGMVYRLCVRLSGSRKAGLLAGGLYAAYGLAIFYSALYLDVTLVTAFSVLLVSLMVEAQETRRTSYWLAAGAVAGLVLALKTNLLLFVPVWLVWVARHKADERAALLRGTGWMVLAAALTLAPFAARNLKMDGRFSPFPTHGGLNFYIGNNPDATGRYMRLPGISDEPIRQIRDSHRQAEQALGRTVSAAEASSYWMKRSTDWIASDPGAYAAVLLRKAGLLLDRQELPSNTNYEFCRRFSAVLSAPLAGFGLVAPLAFVGLSLWWSGGGRKARPVVLYVAAYAASVILLFVTDRYRFPVVPFLAAAAGWGGVWLWETARDPRSRYRLLTPGAVLLVSLIAVNAGTVMGGEKYSTDYSNLGNVLEREGRSAEALEAYLKAVELAPDNAAAIYNLANAYDERGDLESAQKHYLQAIEKDPTYVDALYNLALILRKKGNLDGAERAYRDILAVNPAYDRAYYSLGNVQLQKGRPRAARGHFEEALRINPANTGALIGLAQMDLAEGRRAEAIELYRKVLKIKPDHDKARAALAELGQS